MKKKTILMSEWSEHMKSLLRKKFSLFWLLFIFILVGCTHNSNSSNEIADSSIKSNKISDHFAIVLVKRVQTGNAIISKIEDLQLETQPVITDKDLIFYNWKKHELELRQDFDLNVSLDYVPLSGLPFVVIANDERVYLGAFWTPISSLMFSKPSIMVLPMSPQNTIKIMAGYPGKTINSQSDPRSNQLIYDALKSVGKIKE